MRVSTNKFAQLAQVSPKAVRKARQAGRLVAIAGSTDLDTDHPLNAAFLALHRPNAASLPSDAQIAALVAKAELVQHQLEVDEQSYVDRVEMAERWQWEALAIKARLLTIPARYATQLSTTVGCELPTARRILEKFTHLLLSELDGLEDEARTAVERLH
jgi:hypothetical protein